MWSLASFLATPACPPYLAKITFLSNGASFSSSSNDGVLFNMTFD